MGAFRGVVTLADLGEAAKIMLGRVPHRSKTESNGRRSTGHLAGI